MLKYNIRLMIQSGWWLIPIYMLLCLFLFDLRYLNQQELLHISEKVFVFLGPLALVGIMRVDQSTKIQFLLYQRLRRPMTSYMIRIGLSLFVVVISLILMLGLAKALSSSFQFHQVLLGSVLGALAMGTLGMFVAILVRNIVTGYMITFLYYYFELMTRGTYTKKFYLFSLLSNRFSEKHYLLLPITICILSSALIVWYRSDIKTRY